MYNIRFKIYCLGVWVICWVNVRILRGIFRLRDRVSAAVWCGGKLTKIKRFFLSSFFKDKKKGIFFICIFYRNLAINSLLVCKYNAIENEETKKEKTANWLSVNVFSECLSATQFIPHLFNYWNIRVSLPLVKQNY